MRNLLENLLEKFNSETPELIDNTLANYLSDALSKNISCSEYDYLRSDIENSTDPKLKHELKVKFKRLIEKKIISFNIKNDDEDNLRDAW